MTKQQPFQLRLSRSKRTITFRKQRKDGIWGDYWKPWKIGPTSILPKALFYQSEPYIQKRIGNIPKGESYSVWLGKILHGLKKLSKVLSCDNDTTGKERKVFVC